MVPIRRPSKTQLPQIDAADQCRVRPGGGAAGDQSATGFEGPHTLVPRGRAHMLNHDIDASLFVIFLLPRNLLLIVIDA